MEQTLVNTEYTIFNTIDKIQTSGKSSEEIREDLYRLWRDCFGDTIDYTNFYFDWKVKDNRILTVYKQDSISAMLHLNPYTVMVNSKPTSLNYIVGVATRKEDRRQGLMKLLLEASLNQMYEEQMPFTYLMPAAEAIYLPFGFRIVYEQEPWKEKLIEAAQKRNSGLSLNEAEKDELKVVNVKSNEEEKISALTEFTNSFLAGHYSIYAKRSPYYYKRLIQEMKSGKGNVLVCLLKDEIIGYIAYMTDGGIGIAECIYEKDKKEIFMKAISSEIINKNDTAATSENHSNPTIMARIVNWYNFIKRITAKEEFTVYIKVEDAIITDNNGTYQLQFTPWGCNADLTDQQPELTADISDLTRLFFGRMKENDIAKLNINGDPFEIINKLMKINGYKDVFINDVV